MAEPVPEFAAEYRATHRVDGWRALARARHSMAGFVAILVVMLLDALTKGRAGIDGFLSTLPWLAGLFVLIGATAWCYDILRQRTRAVTYVCVAGDTIDIRYADGRNLRLALSDVSGSEEIEREGETLISIGTRDGFSYEIGGALFDPADWEDLRAILLAHLEFQNEAGGPAGESPENGASEGPRA